MFGMHTCLKTSKFKHPYLYKQFAEGFFTTKMQNPFSLIGFDQNHEQQNKELKMHGGALNLNDEYVFTEWSVAGPEVARIITEFEAGMQSRKGCVPKHHDQSPSVQLRFTADTKELVAAFQKARIPSMKTPTNSSFSAPNKSCQWMSPKVSCVLMKRERNNIQHS